jgi:hypothetical protein
MPISSRRWERDDSYEMVMRFSTFGPIHFDIDLLRVEFGRAEQRLLDLLREIVGSHARLDGDM